MSISVLNTDAALSGKTLVTAEGAYTVEGLHTFDRDPNPPFAVSAGSAAVANLDADKLDGEEGSAYHAAANLTGNIAAARLADAFQWTTWSPTWTNLTIGNATVTARYIQIGKWVHFTLDVVWGNTTASSGNNWSFTLPVTSRAVATGATPLAIGEALDAGTNTYQLYVRHEDTSKGIILLPTVTGSNITAGTLNGTAPFVWTTSDAFAVRGCYEAA